MNVTFAKLSLKSLMAGFFLFGFLLTAKSVGAQSLNWMQPDQAELVLVNQIGVQYGILEQSTPGTPQHKDALTHFLYYRVVHSKIMDGSSVPNAVADGLRIFDGNLSSTGPKTVEPLDELGNIALTKTEIDDLYNDGVDLLTL